MEGLSGTLCWPGAVPCLGRRKGQMNWKPEVCGIFLHRKHGSLLFCLRVLQMLPVEISMVLFSSFLLKHFPSNCDLFDVLFCFFISSTNISATSLYFSHVPAEDVHVVSWNRECVAEPEKRRPQAAAGGGRKVETVKFFVSNVFIFKKNIWKAACCGHGLPLCPSASAAPAACGLQPPECGVVSSATLDEPHESPGGWWGLESRCSLLPSLALGRAW